MIAVDSSAILGILFDEPEAAEFRSILLETESCLGAPALVETHMVLSRQTTHDSKAALDDFVSLYRVRIIPFGEAAYRLAAEAFDRFGRGSGHPARLNFGDCLSYAIAKSRGIGLLHKGDGFARTDLKKIRRR